MLVMQYRSRRSAFSAAMVQAKKVQYSKMLFLAWRVVFFAKYESEREPISQHCSQIQPVTLHYNSPGYLVDSITLARAPKARHQPPQNGYM